MSFTAKMLKKLMGGFILISIINIFITNFILGLPINVQIGFLNLSNFFKSILLSIVGLIQFISLYIFSIGFGGKK